MKIRSHITLMLFPLFMFVALTSGALRYKSESDQLLWGAEEHAKGAVVALAAHLEHFTPEHITGGELTTEFEKLFKWGRAQRIFLASPAKKVVEILPNGATQPVNEVKVPDEYLDIGAVSYQHPSDIIMRAWTRVYNERSDGYFLLGVDTDTSHIAPALGEVTEEAMTAAVGVAALALLLSLILSTLIARKVKALTASIKQIGKSAGKLKNGIISEINDLNNTFQTMDSLLKASAENLKISTSALKETLDKDALNSGYNKLFLKQSSSEDRYLIDIANESSDADFFEVYGNGEVTRVVIGSFVKGSPDIKYRSAAQSLVKQLLNKQLDESQLKDVVQSIFPEVELKDILIKGASGVGLTHTLRGERPEIIEKYTQSVDASSLKELFSEITPMLCEEQQGVVLLRRVET